MLKVLAVNGKEQTPQLLALQGLTGTRRLFFALRVHFYTLHRTHGGLAHLADPHPNWNSWQMAARGTASAFARKGSLCISRKGKIPLETVFRGNHCWAPGQSLCTSLTSRTLNPGGEGGHLHRWSQCNTVRSETELRAKCFMNVNVGWKFLRITVIFLKFGSHSQFWF